MGLDYKPKITLEINRPDLF